MFLGSVSWPFQKMADQEADSGKFSRTGVPRKGPIGQRMSDSSATFHGLWGLCVARCNI